MSSASAAWLAARQPPAPPALAAALAEAAPAGFSPDGAAALAGAAVRALGEALRLGDDRAAAYPLLTADALFTYAVEHAAEGGASSLEAFLEEWGPAAIARAGEAEP